MVRLVVEAPLADNKVRAGVLHPLDHIVKLLFLVLPKFLVLLYAGNVELMLGFRARGLERTGEDSEFRVRDGTRHLRVREVLVDDNTLYEGSVLQSST